MENMKELRMRKMLKEVISNIIRENEEGEPGRPRENPNKFAVWIDRNGGSMHIADRLGISIGQLNKLATDGPSESKPSLELAQEIEELTTGEVPVAFWTT